MLMDSLVKKTDGLQCRSWDIGGSDICIGTLGQVYYAKEVLADLDKDLRGLRSVPFLILYIVRWHQYELVLIG
jgi:hypothetical protein